MTGPDSKMVALTGATGFLGSHIADALLSAGFQVRVAVRKTSNLRWLEGKNLDIREVDLLSSESCLGFVKGASAVIHCAGVVAATHEQEFISGNVETTRQLLKAAQSGFSDAPCPRPTFMLISSLSAHGPAGLANPAVEDSPCRPLTAYGRSKLAAEKLVLESGWGFRTLILRPPGLYGPRDRDFLPLFKAAKLGLTARIGRRLQGLSLVDGRDAAAAAVALLDFPAASGIYFVDDGKTGYTWKELASALGVSLGRKVRILNIPVGLLKFVAKVVGQSRAARSPVLNADRIADLETEGWVCDGSRLVDETGFKPRFNLENGFQSTVQDLRQQGLL